MKTVILVANDNEASYLKDLVFNHTSNKPVCILITGEGRSNVIKTLAKRIKDGTIESSDRVINVGYVGGYGFKSGDTIKIGSVEHFIPSETIKEKSIYLDGKYTKDSKINYFNEYCYTADNFVDADSVGPWMPDKFVCDMELYYIALMFPNVISYKIVSDTLDYDEYKQADFKESWEIVKKEIKGVING